MDQVHRLQILRENDEVHFALKYSRKKNPTWQGFACMRFCSTAILVPPIIACTPIEGWYLNSVFASAAAWFASSLVGHTISTFIGALFWSRSGGGNFTTTSIAGSWKQEEFHCRWGLKKIYIAASCKTCQHAEYRGQGFYQKCYSLSCACPCSSQNILA